MTTGLVGLIAAAGQGRRLYPESKKTSKVLLKVDGKSLVSRTVDIMKDQLHLKRIFILVGQNRQAVEEDLKGPEYKDLTLTYIHNPDSEGGLAAGVLLAEPYISGPFCLMLSDELYQGSSHHSLLSMTGKAWDAVCMVKTDATPRDICKNYTLTLSDGVITSLTEKPQHAIQGSLGCGTFLFKPDIFEAIRLVAPSSRTGRKELVDAVDMLVRTGKTVLPFFTGGEYVNVNTADDLNHANYIVRGRQFGAKTISLVIPAWNEGDSIGHVIDDFKDKVNEIIVADNLSADLTAKVARDRGARVFSARLKGYGDAIRFGMEQAKGDILVVTEADGSFKARDLGKILEYMKDADMVIGTRTTKQMIEQGANMTLFLRFGNVTVAKIIEILWWNRHEPRLTDVGCTYRAIWKHAYNRIKDDLKANGPAFSPEMIIEPIRHYMRIIEIPVSYHGRIGGESKHSGSLRASIRTGLSMLMLILRKRIVYLWIDDIKGWLKDRRS